jgi:hypothetical protein
MSCVFPRIVGSIDYGSVLFVSLPLSLLWLILAIYAFAKYRKRGLWTLLGLPLALYWPYITFALYYECYAHHNCL